MSKTPIYNGADFSQYQSTSTFRNATWEEWFDKIVGGSQQVLGTAQGVKDQITGNIPIDQGSLGDGYGDYQVNSGVNDPEARKDTSPLIWGVIILGAVATLYFVGSAALAKNKVATK